MAFGVFVYRSDSIYEDNPAERYQFPRPYLERAQRCVGDWIIYYEPLVRQTRGYFAVARVQNIIPDPSQKDMFLAIIEPGTYLDFASPVSFKVNGQLVEIGLGGRAQWAVRPISSSDFRHIVDRGLEENLPLLPRQSTEQAPDMVAEERTPFRFEQPRERVDMLTSRVVRDRFFVTWF